jgi:hypothetical protein
MRYIYEETLSQYHTGLYNRQSSTSTTHTQQGYIGINTPLITHQTYVHTIEICPRQQADVLLYNGMITVKILKTAAHRIIHY